MKAIRRYDLGHFRDRVYEAGPWYVLVSHLTRKCFATIGDYWFEVTRHEAARIIRREVG